MSVASPRLLRPSEAVWPLLGRPHRLRRRLGTGLALAVGVVMLIWSLLPTYNMLLIAHASAGDTENSGTQGAAEPTRDRLRVVVGGDYWEL